MTTCIVFAKIHSTICTNLARGMSNFEWVEHKFSRLGKCIGFLAKTYIVLETNIGLYSRAEAAKCNH
jgi:hypothetical protein